MAKERKKTSPSVAGSKKKIKKDKKVPVRKQIKQENKILRNFLFGIVVFIVLVLLLTFFVNYTKNFEYEGVEFDVEKAGEVVFYHTSFPMVEDGRDINYNIYLRNDPRELRSVDFDGEVNLLEMMVLDNTEDFVCDGDGGIAMLNFQQILGAFGTTIIKDPNATCDSQGRYMFLKIQPGDETSVVQFGPACYEININNCEILEGTERFLVELLVEANKAI